MITSRTIDPSALSASQHSNLYRDVYRVDDAVFEYASEAVRERYYADLAAASEYKRVVLYEDGSAVVGYSQIDIAPAQCQGRKVWVVRSSAALLPGTRNGNRTLTDAFRVAFTYLSQHPRRPLYLVMFLTSPGVYRMFSRLAPGLYPSVGNHGHNSFEQALLFEVGQHRFTNLAKTPHHFVASVRRPRTVRTPGQNARKNHGEDFFTQLNPTYMQGHLLGVCLAMSWTNLIVGASRHAQRKLMPRPALRALRIRASTGLESRVLTTPDPAAPTDQAASSRH